MQKNRLGSVVWLAGGAFAFVTFSQARVQLFGRDKILEEAKNSNRFLVSRVSPARRGSILTEDGKPLAENVSARQLCIDFRMAPKSESFIGAVSAASGISSSDISAREESKGFACWSQPIRGDQIDQIIRVKLNWKADGISLGPLPKRHYPLGPYASGLVGSLVSGKPASGLERGVNFLLAGIPGNENGMVDRQGAFLPQYSTQTSVKLDGKDVVTTINSELQLETGEAIREAVSLHKAKFGSAIVMDPQTGNIIAMANWPSYDPDPAMGQPKLDRNSDFDGAYMARMEPGSMFKILTLAKGLSCGKITPDYTGFCPGDVVIAGHAHVRCAEEHGTRAHGAITVETAIARSCNITAARWAMMMGRKNFFEMLHDEQIFHAPIVPLPGAISGTYDRKDPGKLVQLADMGFGQSVTVPPLVLASAFAAIANGGYHVSPRIIDKIGDQVQPLGPKTSVFRPDAANLVLKCMSSVIQKSFGTGYSLRIPGYFLAGKTGTAQIKNGKGGYESNFIGFVPGRAPKVEILVMIDDPSTGAYYGAAVAGPVFKRIAQAVIRVYQLSPTEPITDPKASKNGLTP